MNLGTFYDTELNSDKEKALVGAFSLIVKTDCGTDGSFYSTSLSPAGLRTQNKMHICLCN